MFLRALLFLLLIASPGAPIQTPPGGHSVPKSDPVPSAKTICPWLTQGSAAKALGGEVSVTLNVAPAGEGFCRFSLQREAGDSLEVRTSRAALLSCPANSPMLRGIGNQAAKCTLPAPHGSIEMVSSRTRDLYFTVTLTSHIKNKTVKASDEREDALEQVAEQVAGNLY